MAEAMQCDRCGAFYNPAKTESEFCRFSNPVISTGKLYNEHRFARKMCNTEPDSIGGVRDEVDLCPKCTALLERFMKNLPFELFKKIRMPPIIEWPEKSPKSYDLPISRVCIRYAEDGGTEKEGVIEIRKGVKDLDLGDTNYAQVRIQVGHDHFMKGMAVYSDDIPDGYDVVYNTRHNRGTPLFKEDDNSPSVFTYEKHTQEKQDL